MNRTYRSFSIADPQQIKLQMLNWANRFNICCFLDDHNYRQTSNQFDCILGAGALQSIEASAGHAFNDLFDFHSSHSDWLFGHLSFELKAETDHVPSNSRPSVPFPDLYFFVPVYTCQLKDLQLTIGSISDDHESVYEEILGTQSSGGLHEKSGNPVSMRETREEYIRAVNALKAHIQRGDCYELNYCQEFYTTIPALQPLALFESLQTISPAPFSAFYRLNDLYCLSASPERYLQKKDRRVMSQPIKGTRKRMSSLSDDEEIIAELAASEKERAENVMIVDLVRNDISKICSEGSVKVDELFAIYSFPQVHQMISTISGELAAEYSWVDALAATFPMGSMTGAPKRRVLELIDRYEASSRGLYSGAIGYITPKADFDFNVVIRSVLYNAATGFLNFHAGSAITFHSEPEFEYDECLLKAAFIREVLEGRH